MDNKNLEDLDLDLDNKGQILKDIYQALDERNCTGSIILNHDVVGQLCLNWIKSKGIKATVAIIPLSVPVIIGIKNDI